MDNETDGKERPDFYTMAQFVERERWLSLGLLQKQVLQMNSNGLGAYGGVVRVGRRVLVDGDAYMRWLLANGQKRMTRGAKAKKAA